MGRPDISKTEEDVLFPDIPDDSNEYETAWLIEFSQRVSQVPAYYGLTDEGLGETTDHLKAVRFARREDAQAIIDDIGWNEAQPVEHMWSSTAIRYPDPQEKK